MTAIPTGDTVAVVGAGTMGAGIAQVAAAAGHDVLLYDAVEGAADAGIERTAKGLERLVTRGKMTSDDVGALMARIRPVPSLSDLAPAKLVVEAIIEDLRIKQALFKDLERICGPDAILATNTSSISVTAIGAALERPQRLAGMHYFNPAPVMKLVEVIRGVATDDKTAECLHATCTAWRKTPVYTKPTPGFIVNRVARPFYGEALKLLQEGVAEPVLIDSAIRDCGGFRMGPFELMDLIGIDVNFAVTRSVYEAFFMDPKYRPSLIQQEMVDAGYFGRKKGRGFYHYEDGAVKPTPETMPQGPKPETVLVCGDLGPADSLLPSMENAGIVVEREKGKGWLQIGDLRIALTDGRTATKRCKSKNGFVLFDLALDYEKTPRIVLARADQSSDEALTVAAGLFQSLDKTVSVIDDSPGMIVARTVAMLANEAADTVHQKVCNPDDLDTAMRLGVNYPRGPLEWADALMPERVLRVVENLAKYYGDDRYRPSPLLRRMVQSGRLFKA